MKALGHSLNKLCGDGGIGGGAHFRIARLGAAIADILHGGIGEDHCILRHQPHQRPQPRRIDIGDIDAVDGDFAGLRIVEAQEKLEHRGLSGTARPHQRNRLALGNLEVNAVERRRIRAGGIMEADPVEFDIARHAVADRRRVLGNLHRRHFRQDFEEPLRCPGGTLKIAPDLA